MSHDSRSALRVADLRSRNWQSHIKIHVKDSEESP